MPFGLNFSPVFSLIVRIGETKNRWFGGAQNNWDDAFLPNTIVRGLQNNRDE